jgi:hypothetical protein
LISANSEKDKVKPEQEPSASSTLANSVSVGWDHQEKSRISILTDVLGLCALRTRIHKQTPPMTIGRSQLIDPSVTRWYHCVSRCVRRAFLLGEGPVDRKKSVENQLEELAEIFAIAVGGFSVMDSHLHVLVRLDPDVASGWSGMFEGFSLGSYLLLVDYTGRLFRTGKATISAELAGIFAQLGSPAESWRARREKLRTRRWFGRFFAASRERRRG